MEKIGTVVSCSKCKTLLIAGTEYVRMSILFDGEKETFHYEGPAHMFGMFEKGSRVSFKSSEDGSSMRRA